MPKSNSLKFIIDTNLWISFIISKKLNILDSLIIEEKGRILAYLQAGECLYFLKQQHKTAEIFSIYTLPEARHRFLSVEMVRDMAIRLIELGFVRIYSTVFLTNQTMMKNMFHNPAIWPLVARLEWHLDKDPQFVNGEIENFVERKIA